jgi:hypothetical protein
VLLVVWSVDDFGDVAGQLTDDEVAVAAAGSVSRDEDQFTFLPELVLAHADAPNRPSRCTMDRPGTRPELGECVVEPGWLRT